MPDLDLVIGFDWDAGNTRKSIDKHHVAQTEAESIFSNEPLIVAADERHSVAEVRSNALGRTDQNRLLHVTFTLRQGGTLIRIISSRDMNQKERAVYEKAEAHSKIQD